MRTNENEREEIEFQTFFLEISNFFKRQKKALVLVLLLPVLLVLALLVRDRFRWKYASYEKLTSFFYGDGNLKSGDFIRSEYEEISERFFRDKTLFATFVQQKKGLNSFLAPNYAIRLIPRFVVQLDAQRNRKEYLSSFYILSSARQFEEFELLRNYLHNLFILFNSHLLVKSEKVRLFEEISRWQSARKNLFLNISAVEEKVNNLQKREKDLSFKLSANYQLLIQAGSENERYLDYQAQLAANRILLIDYQRELQKIEKQIKIDQELLELLEWLERNFYKQFSIPYDRLFSFLGEKISRSDSTELAEAIRSLQTKLAIFKESIFSYPVNPNKVPRPQSFYLKLFIAYSGLTFGLFLLVLLFDRKRVKKTE